MQLPAYFTQQSVWFKSGLFWRTFFLLAFLIIISMAAWFAGLRMVERTPRAHQMAAQIISIATITRAALTHSAPDLRRELLFDLASNEGIRIYPLEPTDTAEPMPGSEQMSVIEQDVRQELGANTRFASTVNQVDGFWISFQIEGDQYWLMLDRGRINRRLSVQWLSWAAVVLLLSLLGAAFLSGLINRPLARLSAAARAIAKGDQAKLLPETGPLEVKEANRSFNQMVDDLKRVDSDRALVLAGISHDLRTPLARMLLEIEMASGLADDARAGMQSDLMQMDAIIGQFLDYAKPLDISRFTPIDLSALLTSIVHESERLPDVQITSDIQPGLSVLGSQTELKRVFNNLIENARRYGKQINAAKVEIDLSAHSTGAQNLVRIADHGMGVPVAEMARLLKPFARMDIARSQASGAGLGLAIVERVVKRHNGSLQLTNRYQNTASGGLVIQITLPKAGS